MTHTLEVASIAKTISRVLSLNCDLVEAIAYGHDIGHPSFGHAGEEQLDLFLNGREPLPRYILDCLNSATFDIAESTGGRRFGDFKHNFQSIRQLTFLLSYDNRTEGSNLTYQCLEGILKHTGLQSKLDANRLCKYPGGKDKIFEMLIENKKCMPTLEAKIVALSDEIAQVCHDLSDAVTLDVISLDDLSKRSDVKNALAYAGNQKKSVGILQGKIHDDTNNIVICSSLIEMFIRRTYETLQEFLSKQSRTSKVMDFIDEFPNIPEPKEEFQSLQEFKDNIVINNYNMNRMDNKGKYIIRKLFDAYLCDPRQLPDRVLRRYFQIKCKELGSKGKEEVKSWFNEIIKKFGIKDDKKISEQEINKIITIVQRDSEGTAFRKIDSHLVQRLKPYLTLDADYIRTIVDHIATMTDALAEREMIALYGH
jgi:dGTPase